MPYGMFNTWNIILARSKITGLTSTRTIDLAILRPLIQFYVGHIDTIDIRPY